MANADYEAGLTGRTKKLLSRNLSSDERVEFTIVGEMGQCIVALQHRLLVIKPGFMAGATFGGRVTSFYYRDVNGIEVNTGLITGVIEVNTPSYQGTQEKDFWNVTDKNKDPYKVSNCIPISRWDLKKHKTEVERLQRKIADAKQERVLASYPTPMPNSSGLVTELEKLATLRKSGILTEDEFQQAKKRLLD